MEKAEKKPIKLFSVPFDESTLFNIAEVLASGDIMMGSKVKELEACIAKHMGVDPDQVVAVNSCSTALGLALGATPGEHYKVLVPGLTHVSTINAIEANWLVPKIVDVDKNLMVSVDILEEAWDDKVGGAIIVDYGGRSPDMRAIMDWSHDQRHDIFIWNDCAHSFGAMTYNTANGSLADISCFSMYPTKPLPGAGGGLMVNNLEQHPRIQRRARELRYYGFVRDELGYDVRKLGGNLYLSDLQAAITLSMLKPKWRINTQIRHRAHIARNYDEVLEDYKLKRKVKPRRFTDDAYSLNDAYHLFPVVLDPKIDRTDLQLHLKGLGIETGVHYKPLHELSLYRDALRAPTPYLDSIGSRLLSLPCHAGMTSEDVVRVIEAIRDFIKKS